MRTYSVDIFKNGKLWQTVAGTAADSLAAIIQIEQELIDSGQVKNRPLWMKGQNGQFVYVNWTGLDFQARAV